MHEGSKGVGGCPRCGNLEEFWIETWAGLLMGEAQYPGSPKTFICPECGQEVSAEEMLHNGGVNAINNGGTNAGR